MHSAAQPTGNEDEGGGSGSESPRIRIPPRLELCRKKEEEEEEEEEVEEEEEEEWVRKFIHAEGSILDRMDAEMEEIHLILVQDSLGCFTGMLRCLSGVRFSTQRDSLGFFGNSSNLPETIRLDCPDKVVTLQPP